MARVLRTFRWGEENQDFEFFADIEEAVFDLGHYEDHAAGLHDLFLDPTRIFAWPRTT